LKKREGQFRKSLRPTSDMLKLLGLHEGQNSVTFTVTSRFQGTQTVAASIYLWKCDTKIVISDVDGTITKSDILGNLMPLVGRDWSHSGVAQLYTNIKCNGYEIMYLTSRAIGQANITRGYIHNLRQGETSLPAGPVIMSPDRLLHSFKREIIDRQPQLFKIEALRDVQHLFEDHHNPLYTFLFQDVVMLALEIVLRMCSLIELSTYQRVVSLSSIIMATSHSLTKLSQKTITR